MTNEICSVFYVPHRRYKGAVWWKFPRRVSCENRIKSFSLATQVVTHYVKQGGIFCSTTWWADWIYICVIHSLLSGVSMPLPCRPGYVISRLSIGCWDYAKPNQNIKGWPWMVSREDSVRKWFMFYINHYFDLHLDQWVSVWDVAHVPDTIRQIRWGRVIIKRTLCGPKVLYLGSQCSNFHGNLYAQFYTKTVVVHYQASLK